MLILVGVAVYFIVPPGVKTHLGLDLQGGLEIIYTATTADGSVPTSEQMDQAIAILDRRVNGLGVTESQIQRQGKNQISVALPGIREKEQALSIIGKTAQLLFFKDDAQSRPVSPVASKADALKKLRQQGASSAEVKQLSEAGSTAKYVLVETPPGVYGNEKSFWSVYRLPAAMTGDAISNAVPGFGQDGKPQVSIEFTDQGSKTFQRITRELFRAGLFKNEQQTFAIVLDGKMSSDPMIDYTKPDLQDGISGGAVISGGSMTVQDSKDLAFVLKTGALPVKLIPSYQQQVSATLGKDSLQQGLVAGIIGLGLVFLYMLVYYRFLGLVADLALLVYGILLWGLFNIIPVTLTLPSIAGMILTIGVAADANVVIFERIKEEVRRGKSVRSAVNSGYSMGFRTILDANILTILTAGVLFVFASAQPKGFALTLILGTLTSMFTAILFTRAMLGTLAGFTFFNKPAFMGVKTSQIVSEATDHGTASLHRQARRAEAKAAPATSPASPSSSSGAASRSAKTTARRTSTSRKKRRR